MFPKYFVAWFIATFERLSDSLENFNYVPIERYEYPVRKFYDLEFIYQKPWKRRVINDLYVIMDEEIVRLYEKCLLFYQYYRQSDASHQNE